jgi:hypothetical protein
MAIALSGLAGDPRERDELGGDLRRLELAWAARGGSVAR